MAEQTLEPLLAPFYEIVGRAPDRLAVTDGDRRMSYGALNAAVDGFAEQIWRVRRSDNENIGFLGDVGVARTVAILAIYKAGLASVRLDPTQPPATLVELIKNAGIEHVVFEAGHEALAASLGVGRVTRVETDAPVVPAAPFAERPAAADALFSIAYTSGTTGAPKGVPTTRAVWDFKNRRRRAGAVVGPDDRVAVFNQFWFGEEFAALRAGASVECFDFRRFGPQRLVAWLAERRITRMAAYTAMYRQLSEAADCVFPDMRVVELVGEQLFRQDLEAFDACFAPGARLVNRFASTEHGTITEFVHAHGAPILHDITPLGQPVEPESIALVGPDGAPVPFGEAGEIVVASEANTPGYYNDPERTAAAFAVDPDNPGRTRHRTGFAARWGADGLLHPIGRTDEQVKIRGYNVRPSEVEQILALHPGVSAAAVVPHDGPRNIRRLVCHYAPRPEQTPTAAALRAFLMERAPAYMTPSRFIAHAELPRTATGKLLRAELEVPTDTAPRVDWSGAPDRQRRLADIWADILGHGDFGAEEDFFDVGGDSLQAMSMIVAIEAAFGVRLPFESLILDGAAIEDLDRRIAAGQTTELTPLLRRGDGAPMFAMHVAGGHLSDYLPLVDALRPGATIYGIRPEALAGWPPAVSMAELARHAARRIEEQAPDGPVSLIGYSYGALVAFETARLLLADGRGLAAVVLIDPPAPWIDRLSALRRVVRAARRGDWPSAWSRLKRATPALADKDPDDIDEAHALAYGSYRPAPLDLADALLISAEDGGATEAAAWRELLGLGVAQATVAGDHTTIMRAGQASEMARIIDDWLAEKTRAAAVAASA